MIYENHHKWLREIASDEAKLLAAELCTSAEAHAWGDLLRATPDPLPEPVVGHLVDRLEVPGKSTYPMREIAQRLVDAGRLDALYALAAKGSDLADLVHPFLGKAGDERALEGLFEEFIDGLRHDNVPDTDELSWLEGANSVRWLSRLFTALELLAESPSDQAGFTANAILTLIRSIGGDEAIAGYDRLLATGKAEFRFLRLQRHAIADAELSKDGLTAAATAAREAGVPALA